MIMHAQHDEDVFGPPVSPTLVTARLVLRPRRTDEAVVYRQLWTERDSRVPAHRRIDAVGRPTVADIAGRIRAELEAAGLGLLAVERKNDGDVIGYCGLVESGNGSQDEPELAFELLRRAHGFGYATESAEAVLAWASEAGYERVCAGVRDWNLASRRVLAKVGFQESGKVEIDPAHGDSLLLVRDLRRASA